MAARLVLLAHAPTRRTRELIFGDRGEPLDCPPAVAWPSSIASVSAGPEPACLATAGWPPLVPDVVADLGGLGVGRWTGKSIDELAEQDPDGLRAWLSEPTAAPHGARS